MCDRPDAIDIIKIYVCLLGRPFHCAKTIGHHRSPFDVLIMTQTHRRYHITTFGCQMNKADSERMAGILENIGLELAEDPNQADLILYNTCTIRDNAEQKVYSYILQENSPSQWFVQEKKQIKQDYPCCNVYGYS